MIKSIKYFASFLFPAAFFLLIHSPVYACPAGVLCISICGSSEYECASRPDALNDTFGAPQTKVQAGAGATSVALDKNLEVERVPTTSTVPIPAPSAPATASTVTVQTYGGYPSAQAWCDSVPPDTTLYGCGTTRSVSILPDTRANCILYYATNPNCSGGVCACTNKYQPVSNSTACPAGYTLSGSTCNLTNARAAVGDSNMDFARSGTVLSAATTNDADASIFLDNQSVAKIINGSVQRSGFSPSGNPAHVQITPTSDGGSLVVYTESANNQIDQNTITITGAGSVSSIVTATASGSLVSSQSTGTATVQASANVAAPGTGGATGTSAGLSTAGASEATLQALKQSTDADKQTADSENSSLGSGPAQTPYNVSSLNLPSQSTYQAASTSGIVSAFPVNEGTCVTLPVNLPYFTGLVIDPCSVVNAVRPLVDWMIIVLGVISGLFVWFGKTEEE